MPSEFGKSTIYRYWWQATLKLGQKNDVEFLSSLYSTPQTPEKVQSDWDQYQQELRNFEGLKKTVAQYKQFIHPTYEDFILGSQTWVPLLYATIRIQQPEIVVETGCATGTTASLILYALEKNNKGHLHSVDKRIDGDWIKTNNLSSGFLVPEELKHRWTFIDAELITELPSLLAKLGKVDFFYHDSDHSYVHQMWEYLTAWPYIPVGGIVASDDLFHNTAFFDFSRQIPEDLQITNRGHNFGLVLRKQLPIMDHATIGGVY
ncbi:class I SAM-dependent methyltransferase [candidate division WWE3 bacterium]|nr:class I SAM-dependent methyltransferase [candidate division WWE3 bacterium]